MNQWEAAPAPTKAEFDTLSGQVSTLNSDVANLDLITGQTTGIKTIALDSTLCPNGSVRWFDLRNTAVSDIPANAQYGTARVNKRNASSITITIYDDFGNIYFTSYGGTSWLDWKKVTMTTA